LRNTHGHEIVFKDNFTGSNIVHGTSLSSGKRRVELGEQCQALFRRTTRCHRAEA
jgi:hypothetical protein